MLRVAQVTQDVLQVVLILVIAILAGVSLAATGVVAGELPELAGSELARVVR